MIRSGQTVQVLYVEDDPTIAFLTRDNLELKGFGVTHCQNGSEGLEVFRNRHFDICILDIMLPGMDGFTLAAEIRGIDPHVPVLFLSAKSMTEDKIKAFNLGGDDFITKPFSVEELVLRMEVFLRRTSSAHYEEKKTYSLGRIIFDPANQSVDLGENRVELTRRESEVLEYLVRNQQQIVQREDLLNDVWGSDDYFLGRSLDVFISRLRKILSGESGVKIRNIHGVGFKLEME